MIRVWSLHFLHFHEGIRRSQPWCMLEIVSHRSATIRGEIHTRHTRRIRAACGQSTTRTEGAPAPDRPRDARAVPRAATVRKPISRDPFRSTSGFARPRGSCLTLREIPAKTLVASISCDRDIRGELNEQTRTRACVVCEHHNPRGAHSNT